MNIIYRFLRLFLLTLHFQSKEAATKTQSVGAIRFTDASASYNESFGNVSIAVSNNKLNLYFYNRYPLRNVTFDMDINAKTASATEYKSYFKRSLDYCKFSSNPLSDPFIKVIYEGLRKDKNNKILGKCPVMPGAYYAKDYMLDLSQLPTMFWSNLGYIASLDFFIHQPDKISIFRLEVHGVFQKRNSNRRNRKESTPLIKYVE